MNKKATGIVAYIGAIGWVIAFLAGDKEGAKFHMNQALVLVILNCVIGIIDWVPFIGDYLYWVCSVAIGVFSIIGIVYAAKEEDKELPLIGDFKIMN